MDRFQFLFDLPAYRLHRWPEIKPGGRWSRGDTTHQSADHLLQQMQHIAWYLLQNGVGTGQRVVIVADVFSLEWMATDMAIMSVGAVAAPIHFPMHRDEFTALMANLDPVLCLHTKSIPADTLTTGHQWVSLESIWKEQVALTSDQLLQLEEIRSSLSSSDTATILHTSGSSGEPRAVCLTHRNLVTNLLSILSIVPFQPGTQVMSFLPLSHSFERMVCYVYLACGASVYFLDSYRYAGHALKDIKPSYFTSVPLVLERFATALEERIEEKGWLTRWAYAAWEKKEKNVLEHIGSVIAHQGLIRKWRRKMGGRLKGIVTGAAYLEPDIEKLYERSGIKIRQGYGLTEAAPVVSINRFEPGGYRRGSVGLPLPGVEVKLGTDDEILVKGPNIMSGYFQDESATNQVLIDGWLHTGDIGRIDQEGFIFIVDRKRNIFKHASGKFISPAAIEAKLMHETLIEHAMIVGYHRPYTIALIRPDFDALEKKCAAEKIHWTAPAYMVHNPVVVKMYRDLLDHLELLSHEKIEKFILIADQWTVENGLLTPTYKIRRGELLKKYEKAVEDLYE